MAGKAKLYTKKDEDFFMNYLSNPSPTGYEAAGQKIWLDYVKPYCDETFVDNYGSVMAVVNPNHPFKVVIEAHADEIGWAVNYIQKDGLMNVIRLGGSDHMIAPAKRVNVHTENGIVKGIFGWPAIHTRSRASEKVPKVEDIFLDVGAKDKAEVEEMGIHVGTVITFDDEPFKMNDKYYVSRALDNRAGGFMIAQVLRLLHKNKKKLNFGLYVVNAVQEEIGLRGAQMIAHHIKPNAAIITDVTHDTTTPMIKKSVQGEIKCGDGPALTYAPSVHNNLLDHVVNTAKKKKIDFQRSVASRSTGTDTDAFAYSNAGVPSILISLPLRYMHTTVEAVAQTDVESTIKLMYESLLTMTPDFNFKYL